jgi:two-component system sensor histidine kinase/response regulator
MTQLVNAAVEEVKKTFDKVNAEITVKPLPKAMADYNLMYQVFINLVSNSVKYSSKKEKPVIEIGSKEDKGEIIYYVKDNGIGFDMKYYDKLFGIFQRLVDTSEYEGQGVGLALVKRIITKHDGRVWAEAEPDKGATFYFSLKNPENKESN